MASAMSVTCSSSKHRRPVLAAMPAATWAMGSPDTVCRAAARRSCTSAMNSWKWARRFSAKAVGLVEEIHQHGLAAADGAEDVEALRRLRVGTHKKTGKPADEAVAPAPPARQAARQLRRAWQRIATGRDRRQSRLGRGARRKRQQEAWASRLARHAASVNTTANRGRATTRFCAPSRQPSHNRGAPSILHVAVQQRSQRIALSRLFVAWHDPAQVGLCNAIEPLNGRYERGAQEPPRAVPRARTRPGPSDLRDQEVRS